MQVYDYHTEYGHKTAIIKTEGRKFIHLYMIGETHVRRVPKAEARYMTPIREVTPKDRRVYNKSAVARGGKRGYVK